MDDADRSIFTCEKKIVYTIYQKIIFERLFAIGIRENLLKWIESYLTGIHVQPRVSRMMCRLTQRFKLV